MFKPASFLSANLMFAAVASLAFLGSSCENTEPFSDETEISVPDSYTFQRDGQSTVSYTGQLQRRAMLGELKSELAKGDQGQELSLATLLNMYENVDQPFSSEELNSTTKQLKNKTILADQTLFENYLKEAVTDSKNPDTVTIDNTGAGLAFRKSKGTYVLVNAKGHEYVQAVEKGLMGSVFFHQILNVYLSNTKIGPEVDNKTIGEGKNYTMLEHHWDEAFGYFGAADEQTSEDVYWAKYANTVDKAGLTTRQDTYNAFILGRAAIAANDREVMKAARETLYDKLELITAGTAIHYFNQSINHLNNLNTVGEGEFLHALSEAYMFLRAISTLNPSIEAKLSPEEVAGLLAQFDNHWSFFSSESAVGDLTAIRDAVAVKYPELDAVKSVL